MNDIWRVDDTITKKILFYFLAIETPNEDLNVSTDLDILGEFLAGIVVKPLVTI